MKLWNGDLARGLFNAHHLRAGTTHSFWAAPSRLAEAPVDPARGFFFVAVRLGRVSWPHMTDLPLGSHSRRASTRPRWRIVSLRLPHRKPHGSL